MPVKSGRRNMVMPPEMWARLERLNKVRGGKSTSAELRLAAAEHLRREEPKYGLQGEVEVRPRRRPRRAAAGGAE